MTPMHRIFLFVFAFLAQRTAVQSQFVCYICGAVEYAPTLNPIFPMGGQKWYCDELETLANNNAFDPDICGIVQAYAFANCGCLNDARQAPPPPIINLETMCNICGGPNGSDIWKYHPSVKNYNVGSGSLGITATCGFFFETALQGAFQGAQCRSLQESTRAICQCNGPAEGVVPPGPPPPPPPPPPTLAPVTLTLPPVNPTLAPVNPTLPPVNPTLAPVTPTLPPVNPTLPPVNPTLSPVIPTLPPVNPTLPPVNPTLPPITPATLPPVNPTLPPIAPQPPPPPPSPTTPVAPPPTTFCTPNGSRCTQGVTVCCNNGDCTSPDGDVNLICDDTASEVNGREKGGGRGGRLLLRDL